jgi:hypothetical protein
VKGPSRKRGGKRAGGSSAAGSGSLANAGRKEDAATIDLKRRRDQLNARVAEMQWDLGGLVYEMAIRDHIRVDLLIQRAAAMQALDAELGEVERVMRMEQAGTAGACPSCTALHSRGAAFCWQCGHSLVEQVRTTPEADQAAEA